MVPGSTVRNVIVAGIYLLTFPLFIGLFPFFLGVFVWRNVSGWADSLDSLPGVSAGGGLVSGLAAFVYGLVLFAALGAAFGNGGSGDGGDGGEQAADVASGDTPEPTEAPTQAPETAADGGTPEPTAAPTEPPETATPQPTPGTQHAIGDTFQVGSGAKAIEYTVTDASTATSVGSDSFGEEADGVFLVIEVKMTNVGDESLDLTSNVFSAVDSEDREFDADRDAMVYVDDAVVFEQLNPGLEKQGIIVFDVGPGDDYRLKIEPAGLFSGADSHYVEIGTVEE